jgi:hypothetical protein
MNKFKAFIAKILPWLMNMLTEIYQEAEEKAEVAVKAVSAVKKVVENPSLSMMVAMTETGVDDKYLAKAQLIVAKVALKLGVMKGIVKESETPLQALNLVIDHLRSVKKDARRSWWIEFAAEALGVFMDGKVTFPELVGLTQMVFRKLFPEK